MFSEQQQGNTKCWMWGEEPTGRWWDVETWVDLIWHFWPRTCSSPPSLWFPLEPHCKGKRAGVCMLASYVHDDWHSSCSLTHTNTQLTVCRWHCTVVWRDTHPDGQTPWNQKRRKKFLNEYLTSGFVCLWLNAGEENHTNTQYLVPLKMLWLLEKRVSWEK